MVSVSWCSTTISLDSSDRQFASPGAWQLNSSSHGRGCERDGRGARAARGDAASGADMRRDSRIAVANPSWLEVCRRGHEVATMSPLPFAEGEGEGWGG